MSGAPDFTKLVTPSQVDVLYPVQYVDFPTRFTRQLAGALAKHQYSGIMVTLINGTPSPHDVSVWVENAKTGVFTRPQSMHISAMPFDLGYFVMFHPIAFNVGDECRVGTMALNGADLPVPTIEIGVLGLTAAPIGIPILRPDGRLPAVGAHSSGIVGLANGAVVIPAPTAGVSVLVRQITASVYATASPVGASLQCTVDGTASVVATFQQGTVGVSETLAVDYPQGLLLDQSTGMSWSSSGGNSGAATVLYDLVF